MGRSPSCPTCFSPEIGRSHRRGLEFFVPMLRAFRCRSCDRRFLAFRRG